MSVYLIFVHGVGTRQSPDYDAIQTARDENFRSFVFGKNVEIQNPYWGEFGANPPTGRYKSLPNYDNPTGDGVELLNVGTEKEQSEAPALIALARENFPETVDLIFSELLEDAGEAVDEELTMAAAQAIRYAMSDPEPTWLQQDLNDDEFLQNLERFATGFARTNAEEEAGVETLNPISWLKKGANALKERIRNKGGRFALAKGRETVHGAVARFIGDVFRYLENGKGRADIRDLMKKELTQAVQSGKEIVLVGHSMGGVILADCLSDKAFTQEVGLNTHRQVKALITVGSQPGFFQELELLASDQGKLHQVENWLNIYDELDVLSFRAEPLFPEQARDMIFSSKTGILDAHTAYFKRVQFYERLRVRLKEIGVAGV